VHRSNGGGQQVKFRVLWFTKATNNIVKKYIYIKKIDFSESPNLNFVCKVSKHLLKMELKI
jgi:hypothetical protein